MLHANVFITHFFGFAGGRLKNIHHGRPQHYLAHWPGIHCLAWLWQFPNQAVGHSGNVIWRGI